MITRSWAWFCLWVSLLAAGFIAVLLCPGLASAASSGGAGDQSPPSIPAFIVSLTLFLVVPCLIFQVASGGSEKGSGPSAPKGQKHCLGGKMMAALDTHPWVACRKEERRECSPGHSVRRGHQHVGTVSARSEVQTQVTYFGGRHVVGPPGPVECRKPA